MSIDSQIETLKTKCKSLFTEDIIGKDTCDNISDLLDHVGAFGDMTTVSLTIDVIDDLLGKIG